MNVLALIPARMGSSRIPGKPLEEIVDKPRVGHVCERGSKCDLLIKTVVATCDQEILEYIESIGGEAVMTSANHERASDRCAEALIYLEEKDEIQYDIIVMVQGDEPMTHPKMINEAVEPMLEDSSILVTNLLGDIENTKEFEDKNCIKVVCDLNNNALYFSREPIPTGKFGGSKMKKQVCIIPFKREFLLTYTNLEPTPLEIAESSDMMRVLEHGLKVLMIPTKYQSHAVDTQSDLLNVERIMKTLND